MQKLAHQDIPRLTSQEVMDAKRHPIILVLDNIRSAHNVGSALRTADGFLIESVLLAGYTPTPEHKAVLKTALGAESFVPWRRTSNLKQVLCDLKQQGYTIAALEITDSPTTIEELTPTHFPLVVIAGNEVNGVDDDILASCDICLEIPQYGAKQSLNVSVAIGIALHDLVRQFNVVLA